MAEKDSLQYSPFPDLSGPTKAKPKWYQSIADLGLLTLQTMGKMRSQERAATVSDLNQRVQNNAKAFTTQEEFDSLFSELEEAQGEWGGNKKTSLHLKRLDDALKSLNNNFAVDQQIRGFQVSTNELLNNIELTPQGLTSGAKDLWETGTQLYDKHKITKDDATMRSLDDTLDKLKVLSDAGDIITMQDMKYGKKVSGVPTPEWDVQHKLLDELMIDISMNNFRGINTKISKMGNIDEIMAKDNLIKPTEATFNQYNEDIREKLGALKGNQAVGPKTYARLISIAPSEEKLLLNRATIPVQKDNIKTFVDGFLKDKNINPEFQSSTLAARFKDHGFNGFIQELNKISKNKEGFEKPLQKLSYDEMIRLIQSEIVFEEEQSWWWDAGYFDEPGSVPQYSSIMATNILNYFLLQNLDEDLLNLGY